MNLGKPNYTVGLGFARFSSMRAALIILLLCWNPPAWSQVIVYDNSTEFSEVNYPSTAEHGDQVILAGTARVMTRFQFEYFADFAAQGDEVARLRFYANTGPNWMGNPDYPTPAALPLWEISFPIQNGYQTADLEVPNILVPDTFTWTVQFFGITQTTTPRDDIAGLLFYGTPTVGASYDDFWEKTPSGWAVFDHSGVPKSNFAARIYAVADPRPTLTISLQGSSVRVRWPAAATGFTLQTKTSVDAGTWTNVVTPATPSGDFFEVMVPIGAGQNQFFRLAK